MHSKVSIFGPEVDLLFISLKWLTFGNIQYNYPELLADIENFSELASTFCLIQKLNYLKFLKFLIVLVKKHQSKQQQQQQQQQQKTCPANSSKTLFVAVKFDLDVGKEQLVKFSDYISEKDCQSCLMVVTIIQIN